MTANVSDPFEVINDTKMPELVQALDPLEVQRQFEAHLTLLKNEIGIPCVEAIRVIRYKPKRRCLIEYDIRSKQQNAETKKAVLIGKIKSRSFGKSGYRRLKLFWNSGFQSDCLDGISVPEPIGTISAFRMWFQRKMSGEEATRLLAQPGGESLVMRIAEAAQKIHKTGVPTDRRHSMADELRILHEHLPKVSKNNQKWSSRIERILNASDKIGAALPTPLVQGIHRDFYSDQVIVDGRRLYLIDFDLYCQGDPGLDIGNFIGHITEQSLRIFGDPSVLENLEQAMEERFVELSGEKTRTAVRTYATLTLVRHIYLSTLFPERRPFTQRLIEICEERLDVKSKRSGWQQL